MSPVLELACRVEQVGRASAVAKPAVIEHQRETAVTGEALSERAQPVAPRPGQSVGHYHDRAALLRVAALGLVDPCGARISSYVEFHVDSAHGRRILAAREWHS